jgi:uncharacterized protein (TIGR03086 family)
MSVDTMECYRLAQDGFDAVVAAVPADEWDAASACAQWTVRDVAGHIIWGQEQLRHWAIGQPYLVKDGAPGAPHPGVLAGDDPVATWRAARHAVMESLTDEALTRTVVLPGLGEQPLSAIVTLLVTDHLAHSWDIGHGIGLDVRLDPHLIAGSLAWARDHVIRAPGFFGPELSPPPGTDEQARWLAYLGRAGWQQETASTRIVSVEAGS